MFRKLFIIVLSLLLVACSYVTDAQTQPSSTQYTQMENITVTLTNGNKKHCDYAKLFTNYLTCQNSLTIANIPTDEISNIERGN